MSDSKYLLTVKSENGEITRVQMVGDAGEMTDVDPAQFGTQSGHASSGAAVVINIYGAGSGHAAYQHKPGVTTDAFQVIGPTIPRVVNPPKPGPPVPPPGASEAKRDK